jgi:hypothetical protein
MVGGQRNLLAARFRFRSSVLSFIARASGRGFSTLRLFA